MGLHLCPIEPNMEPDEYPDPLDAVEFPRERKPWKRDRHVLRSAMQGAINRRCWANVGGDGRSRDHSLGYWTLNHAEFEVRRALLKIDDLGRMHPQARAKHVARLRRYILAHRRFDNPRLPGFDSHAGIQTHSG